MLQSEHFLQRIGFASGLVLNKLNSSVLCLSLMQRVCRRPNHLNTPDKTHTDVQLTNLRGFQRTGWRGMARSWKHSLLWLQSLPAVKTRMIKTQNWTQSLSTGFVCWKLLHSKFFYKSKKLHKTATDQADQEENKNVKESRIVPVTFLQQLPP